MVQTTLKEVFSGSPAPGGRSSVRRGRMKGRQNAGFAAILEKTLNAAASGKKAAAKHRTAGIAEKARAAEKAPAEKRALPAGNKKPAKLWEESPSAGHAAEKRAEIFAWAAMTPGEEKRPMPAEASPGRSGFPKNAVIPAQETGKDGFLPAMNLPAGEGKQPASEKPRPAAEKKISAKQEAEAPRRKENREEAKKTEKQEALVLAREVKPSSPEEQKQETPRREIEIQVVTRAGDERFDDVLRTADERSVKESASGLLRRMREDANSDIVRSARIILKDSNEGEIRLVLKPASLGEVRIQLSVQDNLIGGRILVENESVRSVFEQNMPDLASSFRESGLQLGEL
ncbi:MAG: flagellar hook-length control protein FliK, partial [Spirochaetaceae bacterium]|nr:flagellar hook-length control protein FliK [Spirochaetaceae bacterium]